MKDMTPEERERYIRRMPSVFDGRAGWVLLGVILAPLLVKWLT